MKSDNSASTYGSNSLSLPLSVSLYVLIYYGIRLLHPKYMWQQGFSYSVLICILIYYETQSRIHSLMGNYRLHAYTFTLTFSSFIYIMNSITLSRIRTKYKSFMYIMKPILISTTHTKY